MKRVTPKHYFVRLLILVLSLFLSLHAEFALSTSGAKGIKPVEANTSNGQALKLYETSHALLIGVSDYTNGWSNLPSISSELEGVAAVLKQQGFSIQTLSNPGSSQLKREIQQFINKYGYDSESRLIIYYSGHGYSRQNGNKGYLVPTDSPSPLNDEKGFLRKALSMSQILAWAREMEVKHALFLFDSCFSGTVFKTKSLPKRPPYISQLTAKPVRQFITAGSAGEPVPAQSAFTPSFVDGIKYGLADLNRDGYVSGTELGLYLQSEVPKHTQQTPQYGKINDYNLSRGDFIFVTDKSHLKKPVDVAVDANSEMDSKDESVFGNGMSDPPKDVPDQENKIQQSSPTFKTVLAEAQGIDNPIPIDLGIIYKVTLEKNGESYFKLSSPASNLKLFLDTHRADGRSSNLVSTLSVLDQDGSSLQDNVIRFNEIDVSYRKTALWSAKQPTILGFKLRNKQTKTAHFWLTALEEPALQFIPFLGELVPKKLALGESSSGILDPNEYVYYITSLPKDDYKVILDFTNSGRVSTNIHGYLAILNTDGGDQRKIINFNEIDVSYRKIALLSLKKDETLIMKIQNTSKSVNFKVKIIKKR